MLQVIYKEEAAAALKVAVAAAASESVVLQATAAADKEKTAQQLKRISQELEEKADMVEEQREALQVELCIMNKGGGSRRLDTASIT